jgi:predicted GH43/DUF377 family glycosyl hydrolase
VWSLTLREEYGLRVIENKVLSKIFGDRRDEITGDWMILHYVELHHLHSSLNIIWAIDSRRIRWVGHVACMGERRGAYRVLMGQPEGK